MSEISPPNSPLHVEDYQDGNRQSGSPTPSTAATLEGAGKSIPADESGRSDIIDALRVSAAARRSSGDGDDGSGGGGDRSGASVVASGEGATAEVWAEECIPGKDRENLASILTVNPLLAGGTTAGIGGGSSPGFVVCSPSSIGRGLQLQPLSKPEGFPTEELGPAPTEEEGDRLEDEEQAKSCTSQ